eukprot:scaffold249353_cov82-Cyclotella_meneghiniana.AAC.6
MEKSPAQAVHDTIPAIEAREGHNLIELNGRVPVFESEIESLELCDSKQQEQIMHQSTVTSADPSSSPIEDKVQEHITELATPTGSAEKCQKCNHYATKIPITLNSLRQTTLSNMHPSSTSTPTTTLINVKPIAATSMAAKSCGRSLILMNYATRYRM